MNFFHQKWVNLNYNYENWRWNRTIIKNTTENNMKCFYEIDSNNREEAPNDQLSIDKNFVGLKLKESEILEKILANRLNLFTTYPMLPPPDPSNQFNEVDVMKQKLYTKLLVKCEELKFDMGEYEPFFGTLALYDLENNIKLSEIFEFTLSSPDIIEKLGYFLGQKDPITMAKQAIFSLREINPNIHFVLLVYKTIKGDGNEDMVNKFYINFEKRKEKDINKFQQQTDERLARQNLVIYKEPFVIDWVPICNENYELIDGDIVLENLRFITKIDKDVFNTIQNLSKEKKEKKNNQHTRKICF